MTVEALGDVRVVDLAWVVAGPAIGRSLADYGATVVRVESSVRIETARFMGPFPGGLAHPDRSALYGTYNAGKLGMALHLGTAQGQAVLWDLIRWADVLIESFAPGQLAKWGMSPNAIHAINPGLIGVSSSLLGQTGPHATVAGYGNMGAAVAGFQGLVGRPNFLPIGPYGPYTDYIGPRFSLVALLAALDRRRTTKKGCWIDVSQVEAGVQFLAPQIAEGAATRRYPGAIGNRDARFAPHGVFRCAGRDAWVALAIRDDEEWASFAELLGSRALDPVFATLEGRKTHEDDIEALVEGWTLSQSPIEIERILQARNIPAHQVSSSSDMLNDPQLKARGQFVVRPHRQGGDAVFDSSRYTLSDTPAHYRGAAPCLNQDTIWILESLLGYDQEQIAALEDAGVLR